MSELLALAQPLRALYPERKDRLPEGWLERAGVAAGGRVQRAIRAWIVRRQPIVRAVNRHAAEYAKMDMKELAGAARDLRRPLRRDGFRTEHVARAFALIREVAGRTVGMRHFDVQLQGGWIMLNGMIAEMQTGEGKTLTATLPACTAALAGLPVHVVTVNDYLVSRDAEIMTPVYQALGLTVGTVVEGQAESARQAAYRCDVTYVTNKLLVFDYLRDRITLGQKRADLQLHLEKLYGPGARVRRLLLRGLNFAIVDEADSVLVDEARTPLIISAPASTGDDAVVATQGIKLAEDLVEREDYVVLPGRAGIKLTDRGKRRLDELCAELGGVWSGLLRREELAMQALTALKVFHRDEHYLVRDGKIQIIDEHTGRIMEDRSWERGLHQLVEAKEGCEITGQKEPLARISYQRFFRRYLLVSGMTGTAAEVKGELGAVYGLAVARVPTNRPGQRRILPTRLFATEKAKWAAIAESVREFHKRRRPVLLGTRSVAASEIASELLTQMGLDHRVLNAKQDKEEAEIVKLAGEPGRITIATNMAGRGTDIKLEEGVAEVGGLHVILSERYDSARIDRQLEGRCGRQGDPGSFQMFLSMEDGIMQIYSRTMCRVLRRMVRACGPQAGQAAGRLVIRSGQRLVERAHSRIRRSMLKVDDELTKLLSFSGRPE